MKRRPDRISELPTLQERVAQRMQYENFSWSLREFLYVMDPQRDLVTLDTTALLQRMQQVLDALIMLHEQREVRHG